MIEIYFERLKDQHFQQFRELSEAIMYILPYVKWEVSSNPKKKSLRMRICRVARSWHPSRVSVFPMKRDDYSWREIFSRRENLEKLLRINHKNQYTWNSYNDLVMTQPIMLSNACKSNLRLNKKKWPTCFRRLSLHFTERIDMQLSTVNKER